MINITEEKFLAAPKKVLDQLRTTRERISVSSGSGGYVIINSDEWQNIRETICLNRIPGPADSIIEASREAPAGSISLDKLDW